MFGSSASVFNRTEHNHRILVADFPLVDPPTILCRQCSSAADTQRVVSLHISLATMLVAEREQAQPPLAGASMNWNVGVEVIRKLGIGTSSGWLHRFNGHPAVIHGRAKWLSKARSRGRL
jgi:hypothetical protein